MAYHQRGGMSSLRVASYWTFIFMLYIQAASGNDETTLAPTSDPVCGRTLFTENSGVITSPWYPYTYPDNINCIYNIRRPHGVSTHLQSTHFQLEDESRCRFDFVKIYEGSLTNHYIIFCGDDSIYLVTSSNFIAIEFRTDFSITDTGFRIEFGDASTTFTNSTVCGPSIFLGYSGVINSPNYPGQYPDYAHCIYTIHRYSLVRTLLRSHLFNLEYHSLCIYDYVKIYTDFSTGNPSDPIGVYCGTQAIDLILTSRHITVEFYSDRSVTGHGFQLLFGDPGANLTTIEATTARTATSGCGGTWHTPAGVIASPNYPSNYDDNSNCVYVIHVYNADHITLHVDHFDLENASNCQYDSLKIFDGDSQSGRVVQILCGSHSGRDYDMSNYVTLHFISDNTVTRRGFLITYTTSIRTTTRSPRSGAVVVFRDEDVSLECSHGLGSTLFWYWGSNITFPTPIAIYITAVGSVRVFEPWKGREWDMNTTNGNLVIPEVLLSDEGVYSCGVFPDFTQVKLRVYVRPSLFTLEATPMPVEVNADITATCVANEILPEPEEFYWVLGDTVFQGLNSTTVVNSAYDIVSVQSTFRRVAYPDDDGKDLTCVLVMQNGWELNRSLHIDIIFPTKSNILVIVLPLVVVVICILLGVIIGVVLVRNRRKRLEKGDSGNAKRVSNAGVVEGHGDERKRKNQNTYVDSTSVPQNGNHDNTPGSISNTHLFENVGFEASEYEVPVTSDNASCYTQPDHLQYDNNLHEEHTYESIN